MCSRNREYNTYTAHQKPTVGDYKYSAVGIDHLGWLTCDGRSVNVSDYQLLFNVIHYSFGGSGNSFNLPNPAGRVPGFVGAGAGLTARSIGSNVGAETHTLTVGEMPTHNHTGTTSNATTGITTNATGPTPGGSGYGLIYQDGSNTQNGSVNNGAEPNLYQASIALNITDPGHNHLFTTSNTGGSNAHNNMQPTLFIGNMFIYSGKLLQTNPPFTTGYYGIPPVSNYAASNIQ